MAGHVNICNLAEKKKLMKAVIETFKDIPGYTGLYQVSNYGCVRSLNYQGKKRIKYLRNAKTPKGYCQICLCRDGKQKMLLVHRLVYEAFVGEIPEGYEIDHVNAIRDDNRLSNLRVVTRKGNMANPITAERNREAQREKNRRLAKDAKWIEAHLDGTRKALSKPVLQIDKTTSEVIREWECAADAWRELRINVSHISECCNGNRKSAGGFKWKFADQT